MSRNKSEELSIGGRFDDENVKKEIEKLIVDEPDPKEKVRLLMLMQLNGTLLNNVVAVRNLTTEFKEHRIEFETHVHNEERKSALKRGAVWGILAVVGVVQVLTGYIFTSHMKDFSETQILTIDTAALTKLHGEKFKSTDEKLNRVLDKLDKIAK